jgi:hypothetical protein
MMGIRVLGLKLEAVKLCRFSAEDDCVELHSPGGMGGHNGLFCSGNTVRVTRRIHTPWGELKFPGLHSFINDTDDTDQNE